MFRPFVPPPCHILLSGFPLGCSESLCVCVWMGVGVLRVCVYDVRTWLKFIDYSLCVHIYYTCFPYIYI